MWFLPATATPPEDWDVKKPHRTRPGWVVYIRWIIPLLVVLCGMLYLLAFLGWIVSGTAGP